MSGITWINAHDAADSFPSVEQALREPDGLLCAGGDLSATRLLYAYSHGIFPWYEQGQPLLWWSPDPRCVISPASLYRSRRLKRYARTTNLDVSFNQAFQEVITACAADREDLAGTWITAEMIRAYCEMHQLGWAHSVEIWDGKKLVGGLYGLAIGRVFFGESMFSHVSNASKLAMAALCKELLNRQFVLFDCQVASSHLMSLGASLMPRSEFSAVLDNACEPPAKALNWPSERSSIVDSLED